MEQWATTQEAKWWITAAELCLIGETMREGQDLTSPQYFVVVKRAEQEIFEWVAFRTNEKAMRFLLYCDGYFHVLKIFLKKLIFYFKLIFLIFLYNFNILISKIIYKKNIILIYF